MYLPRTATVLLLITLCSCIPFLKMSEVNRIEREAKELYNDAKNMLPESLKRSAELSIRSIDLSFEKTTNPDVLRFVANTAATTIAHEAAEHLLLNMSRKIDKVFGTDHSDAIVHVLLHTYCYPLLDEIITAEINRRLPADGASPEDVPAAPLDSIITDYLKRFDIDHAAEIIKGFSTRESTPDYYQAVGMSPITTATYTATRNWKDHGITYQFRIDDNGLSIKRSDEQWKPLPLPGGKSPKMIAADNNRCLVLTTGNELWWYCIRQDQAQWSIDLMQTAVAFMALKPVVGEELCSGVVPTVTKITDSITSFAAQDNHFEAWDEFTDKSSDDYWNKQCSAWTDIALSLDKLLLKTGDGTSFTANDYAEWSRNAHAEGNWSNLLRWKSGDATFYRGHNIPNDSITDIAIGNWNGTVVTAYIAALGKIWFIDEEVIQPDWKVIENWNSKWAIIANEYHPIENSPYPLDTSCRINASNSVIAVSKNNAIYWLRWDYHQKDDFVYWPLDWCEHSWYKADCPPMADNFFRIATGGTIDPREKNTVWSIPAPAFTFHTYLPKEGYQGIFGDVPRKQVSTYPVDLFIRDTSDAVRHFSLHQAKDMNGTTAAWKTMR